MTAVVLRKLVIPALLPVLFINLWILNKIFDVDLDVLAAIGVYCITTLIPTAFAIWYGWELKKEFINVKN